jgi:hypothetical protein
MELNLTQKVKLAGLTVVGKVCKAIFDYTSNPDNHTSVQEQFHGAPEIHRIKQGDLTLLIKSEGTCKGPKELDYSVVKTISPVIA